MDLAERRLPHDQHQASLLLQHDVGGAVDQVVALAMGDRGEGLHAAGRDDHAQGEEGAAGERGALVVLGVGARGHGADFGQAVRCLVEERARPPPAQDEVALDVGGPQRLQQPHAIDDASGAGDADDQASRGLPLAHLLRLRLQQTLTCGEQAVKSGRPIASSTSS